MINKYLFSYGLFMNEKNTKTLAKYLLTKSVDSALKIQKMLFFFRVVEEKRSNFPSQKILTLMKKIILKFEFMDL